MRRPAATFERSLLALYCRAIRSRRWNVAEHLLAALEAESGAGSVPSGALSEAYAMIALLRGRSVPGARIPAGASRARRHGRRGNITSR